MATSGPSSSRENGSKSKRSGSARKKSIMSAEMSNNIETEEDNHNSWQDILDGMIGEEYLQRISGSSDLEKVRSIKLTVDTSIQSIHAIDELVPNLEELVLDGSVLSSVRDLGVGFRNLRHLSLANCSLCDLDGIGALNGLRELNLSNNSISEVISLAMHDSLEVLNLSGNQIGDLSVADALSTCPRLRSVFLARNPIAKLPKYSLIIASLLPNLESLDGVTVDRVAANKITNAMILEAASIISVAHEEKEDEMRMESLLFESNSSNTSYAQASGSGGRDESFVDDTGSDLTHGDNTVLAGSVAAAMRKRRMKPHASSASGEFEGGLSNSTESMSAGGSAVISTIDMLDSALSNKTQRGGAGGGSDISCFIEGDITLAVAAHYGIVQLEDVVAAPHSPVNGAHLRISAESPQPAKRPPSRAAAGAGSSSATRVSKSRDGLSLLVNNNADNTDRELIGPFSNGSIGDNNTSIRPMSATKRGQAVIQYNSSGRPVSRAGLEDLASVIGTTSSLGSSFAGASVSDLSRINSSRGNISSNNNDSKHSSRKSSFSDNEKGTATGSQQQNDTDSSIEALYRLKSPYQHNSSRPQSSALIAPSSGSSDSGATFLGVAAPFMVAVDDSVRKTAGATLPNVAGGTGTGKSSLFGGHNRDTLPSSQHSDDESEEEEEVNVFRSRLMFQNTTRPGSAGSGGRSAPTSRPASASRNSSRPSSGVKSKAPAAEDGVAAKAGASLGFNLSGSLAAIEQWVEAMDSDDDDIEGGTFKSAFTITADRKRSQQADNNASGKGSNKSVESTAPSSKILSRDSILSMCSKTDSANNNSNNNNGRVDRLVINHDEAFDSDEDCEHLFVRGSGEETNDLGELLMRSRSNDDWDDGFSRTHVASKESSKQAKTAAPLNLSASRQNSDRLQKEPSFLKMSSVDNSEPDGDGLPSVRVAQDDETIRTHRPISGRRSNGTEQSDRTSHVKGSSSSSVAKSSNSSTFTSQLRHQPTTLQQEVQAPESRSQQSSPPRHEESDSTAHAATIKIKTGTGSSASAGVGPRADATFGEGVFLSDAELVALLRMPPKTTDLLRKKSDFQEFFRGIRQSRMVGLLNEAYSDLGAKAQAEKVAKRLELLREVMS